MKYDITHALTEDHGTSSWVCWNSNYAGLEWNDSSKTKYFHLYPFAYL